MKRIVVLCDGTWQGTDSASATNVCRLARAISPIATDGTTQLILYYPGIGADQRFGKLSAGAFGRGIDAAIQHVYRDLIHNVSEDDQLFLFGFSRGAYTVRSVIGLIRNCGLLHRAHAGDIGRAYEIYRTRWGPDADNAVQFRTSRSRSVSVRFLGVWDTVGALGIPLALFDGLNSARYAFHDTRISRIVNQACHALAIDERRNVFEPTLWKTDATRRLTEQRWFSGSHGDIGGSFSQRGLARISLTWMAQRAADAGLDLDTAILHQHEDSEERLHTHIPLPFRLFGTSQREIGRHNHDETLDPTAEQRFLRDADYRPGNLRRYLQLNDQIQLPL